MVSDGKSVMKEPIWASLWQFTIKDAPADGGAVALTGKHEFAIPLGCPVIGIGLVGRRLFASVGMMDGEDHGDMETVQVTVRSAGERFPPRESGRLIGEVTYEGHWLYVFDTSPDVLEEVNDKFDAIAVVRRIKAEITKEG